MFVLLVGGPPPGRTGQRRIRGEGAAPTTAFTHPAAGSKNPGFRCATSRLRLLPGDGRRRVSPCRSPAAPGDQPRQSRSEAALLQWVSPVLRIRMQDRCSAAKPIKSHTGADARMTGGGVERVPGPG